MKLDRTAALGASLAAFTLATPSAAQDTLSFDTIDAYAAHYRDLAAFDGVVLVRQNGETIYSRAFGEADYRFHVPMGTSHVFRIASLSKQVTLGLVGRLADRGVIALEDPLSGYLPGYPNAASITIAMLLDGTSGIPHTNDLAWMEMHSGYALSEIVHRLAQTEPAFAPGADTAYSNGAFAVAAAVIEQATGLSFAESLRAEFGADYPSLLHEDVFAIIAGAASRYAPGPVAGERREAAPYVVANRIGGGSLTGNADDIARFFEDSFAGRLVSAEMTAALFRMPSDGDTRITGRSPGALAQIYLDANTGLTVVTLSSNSAWPGGFNADITALARGETVTLLAAHSAGYTAADWSGWTGRYRPTVFNWQWDVRIEAGPENLVYVQDGNASALIPVANGEFHLPLYDWLCAFGESGDGPGLTCRQRDPDADIRFTFARAAD